MAVTVREAALFPGFAAGIPCYALWSSRPVLIDLPFDIQVEEIEFDPEMYEPLPVAHKPAASRKQIEKSAGNADSV